MKSWRFIGPLLVSVAMLMVVGAALAQDTPPRTRANSPEAFIVLYVDRADDTNVLTCNGGVANDCTLRGAINKANGDPANIYTINFTPTVAVVNLANQLPVLTADDLWILGVNGSPRIDALSVAVGSPFTINADRVKVAGLAIVNASNTSTSADISISGGTQIEIEDNYLGTLPGATNCSPAGVTRNTFYGVSIDAAVTGSNGAGSGSVYIYGNTIGCHVGSGIVVGGADYVRIGERTSGLADGNTIGVSAGGLPLTNSLYGIYLVPAAGNAPRHNVIANNVIAGNGRDGIYLSGNGTTSASGAYNNVIRANRIGLDASGARRQNAGNGVYIINGAFQNFIGGTGDADRNIISGNLGYGVWISDSVGIGVLGNTIGANVTGTAAISNGLGGIQITAGEANVIGGALYGIIPATKGNRIQYNGGRGVQLSSGSHANVVAANDIRYNTGSGVGIDSGAYDNLVGGSVITSLNFIDSNGGYGVFLRGSTTTSNVVKYNDILYNSLDGILIDGDAHGNQIGGDGPSDYNLISANGGSGIRIFLSGPNNVSYNSISYNSQYGVLLDGSQTQFTTITNTTIAHNGYDGIGERNGAGLNRWSKVGIYGNGGLGIDKNAGSDTANFVNAPIAKITAISTIGGSTTLTGTGQNATVVEVYGVYPNWSGFGEGKTYLGADTVSGGQWSLSVPGSAASCFTLFESFSGFTASEFGANTCRVFLPTVLK